MATPAQLKTERLTEAKETIQVVTTHESKITTAQKAGVTAQLQQLVALVQRLEGTTQNPPPGQNVPAISNINPSRGTIGSGDVTITITGQHLDLINRIIFPHSVDQQYNLHQPNFPAFQSQSPTEIKLVINLDQNCAAPNAPTNCEAGTYNLHYQYNNGQTGTMNNAFEVIDPNAGQLTDAEILHKIQEFHVLAGEVDETWEKLLPNPANNPHAFSDTVEQFDNIKNQVPGAPAAPYGAQTGTMTQQQLQAALQQKARALETHFTTLMGQIVTARTKKDEINTRTNTTQLTAMQSNATYTQDILDFYRDEASFSATVIAAGGKWTEVRREI
jgi:hypothetical protein